MTAACTIAPTDAARLWEADRRPPGRLWRRPISTCCKPGPQAGGVEPALGRIPERIKGAAETRNRGSLGLGARRILAMVVATATYATKERQRANAAVAEARTAFDSSISIPHVERARQLLLEEGSLSEAMLRLQRAQIGKSSNPLLPDLMHGALLKLEATRVMLVGHEQTVRIAAYSPDGKRIVTASETRRCGSGTRTPADPSPSSGTPE